MCVLCTICVKNIINQKKNYKPITVLYYITDCVSWIPRLTLLDLGTCWAYECSFGTCLYIGDFTFLELSLNAKMLPLLLTSAYHFRVSSRSYFL